MSNVRMCIPAIPKMVPVNMGYAAKSKFARRSAISSMVNVLNVGVMDSSNSSGEVGMVTPPNSVKWRTSQCMKPSGTLFGGGAGVTPSELHIPLESSQY
jgi:hypothetical protein